MECHPTPSLSLPALLASWTYRVWLSDSSCLVIQLLSPFSVVRTFICLRTLLRSSSPGGRGFPGGGKARQHQKWSPAPGRRGLLSSPPNTLLSLGCPGSAVPCRAGLEGGSHVPSPGQEGTQASPLLPPPRAEILMVFALNVPSRWIQQGSWGQRQAHGLSLHAFIMARGSPYGPWQIETMQTVLWVESGQRPPLGCTLGSMAWPARGSLLERWLRQADHQLS